MTKLDKIQFYIVVKGSNKIYIKINDKEKLYISENAFNQLKKRRYIVYIDSLDLWVFYLPKEKMAPSKEVENIKKVGFKSDLESEYIAFEYQREKRNYTIEYRQKLSSGNGKDITFVPCDLLELIYNGKWLSNSEKASASESQIGIGRLKFSELWKLNEEDDDIIKKAKEEFYKDDEIVIKLNFESKIPKKDNSSEIESIIYKNFIFKMLNNNQTPHVMIPLFQYQCVQFSEDKIEKNKSLENLKNWYNSLSNDKFDKTKLNVLILEKGKGQKFEEWLKEPHTELSWKTVLFQIVWTLQVFSEYGLIHNDLHSENIFIEKLEEPIWGIYFLNEKDYFVLPINYFVKIYDFDRSSVKKPKESPINKNHLTKIVYQTFISKLYKEKIKSQKNGV